MGHFQILEAYTQVLFRQKCWCIYSYVCIICRTRFCCPDCSVTQTCWRPDWCSARAVSSGCCLLSWATVRVAWNSQNILFLFPSFPYFILSARVSFRFCRLSAQVVFSGRNERVSDSVPAVRGAPSAGVPASHGLRAQVSTRWLFHRDLNQSGLLISCVLQGCEGESCAAVSWRPCVFVGAAECVQSDEGRQEDESRVWHASTQSVSAALAESRAAATGDIHTPSTHESCSQQ